MLDSKEITIEVTNLCNAHCITCPREALTQKKTCMPLSLFQKIIDDAAMNNYTSVDTCGFGEPLLDPALKDKFKYIKSKYPDIKIYTSTTCFLLDSEKMKWFPGLADTVKISCYGISQETYQKLHNLSDYKKARENILRLVEYRKKNGKPYLIGLFLLVDENKNEMDQWIKYWQPKLDEVMVWKPHNWVWARDYRKKTKRRKTCGRPFNGNLTVGVDGRVSICCFDFNKTVTIGDLNKQSIMDVKEKSPVLKEICRMHKNLDFDKHDYLCKNCDQTFEGCEDILVYSSNDKRRAGIITSHNDYYNDMFKKNFGQ